MQNNSYFKQKIASELLEVSRVATFFPSMKEVSIDELMNIWNQYQSQSMNALFLSLNIEIEKYNTFFEKYDIDSQKIIDRPWENEKIQSLFSDKKYIALMNEEKNKKIEELIKYFENKKIKNDSTPLSIVDIGWRGTIQDNIAKIFTKKEITGYYLALFKYFNEQPKNVSKKAIIEEQVIIDEYVGGLITCLEMLFIPNSGSVIAYENGQAIRKMIEEEYQSISNFIVEIQSGMLSGIEELNRYFEMHPYDMSEIYNEFKKCIISTRKKPNKRLVDVYFNLFLNNNFGSGNYVSNKHKMTLKDKLHLKKCVITMRKEPWKEAFLIYNKLYILKFFLTIKKKISNRKKV